MSVLSLVLLVASIGAKSSTNDMKLPSIKQIILYNLRSLNYELTAEEVVTFRLSTSESW